MRKKAVLLLLLCLLLSAAGCGPQAEKHEKVWYDYFDTVTSLIYYGSEEEFERLCSLAEPVLADYHRLTDIYNEYDGLVNAATVNRRAGETLPVDSRLLQLLVFGRDMAEATGGSCNLCMGSVLSLWHETREAALAGESVSLPPEEALREAAAHCDWQQLLLDEAAGTVCLADPAMSLDLGAVAKGYVTGVLAEALQEAGFCSFALSLGGNVYTAGAKPDGTAWVSGIQNPFEDGGAAYLTTVSLTDEALVTSGSYQRYFELEDVRYHHIISPKTLYPENRYVSVTVRCADPGVADALSTALFNLEEAAGDALLAGFGAEVCRVYPDGTLRCSAGWG